MDKIVACPYCLTTGKLYPDFRKVNIDGTVSKHLFQCHCCLNVMKEVTLKMELTVEEYAKWLYYNIRINDIYDKIAWEDLKINLKLLDMSKEFWDCWRDIKINFSYDTARDFLFKIDFRNRRYHKDNQKKLFDYLSISKPFTTLGFDEVKNLCKVEEKE